MATPGKIYQSLEGATPEQIVSENPEFDKHDLGEIRDANRFVAKIVTLAGAKGIVFAYDKNYSIGGRSLGIKANFKMPDASHQNGQGFYISDFQPNYEGIDFENRAKAVREQIDRYWMDASWKVINS